MKINIFIYTKSQILSQHWLTAGLPYLIHNMVASYFPDETADYIFD